MDTPRAKARQEFLRYLEENPGAKPGDVLRHFFPKPQHGFSELDLSDAFIDMMDSGRVEADAQWRMTLKEGI